MTEDAWLTMPPLPLQYQGRKLAAEFLTATAFRPGWTARLIPARANGQPAFGLYVRDPGTGSYHTVGLMVLTLSGAQVSAMTRFDPAVLPRFGAPAIPHQLSQACISSSIAGSTMISPRRTKPRSPAQAD
jgi:RNA polymerase sigma-70 factor (ECF subfamily)